MLLDQKIEPATVQAHPTQLQGPAARPPSAVRTESDCESRGCWFGPSPAASFVEIHHEIISVVILPLPLIQERQMSVSEKVCALSNLSLPRNSVVRLTDCCYMTEILLLRRKTPTQALKSLIHLNKLLYSLNKNVYVQSPFATFIS